VQLGAEKSILYPHTPPLFAPAFTGCDSTIHSYFCRFVPDGTIHQPGAAEASIDSFWKMFPATSQVPRYHREALAAKRDVIDAAAWNVSFTRAVAGYTSSLFRQTAFLF
jgi:hypothetical protein